MKYSLCRDESYTYAQLKEKSDKFGNALRKHGVGKGDRVFIFMPRSPELYVGLLGIPASHGGFGPTRHSLQPGHQGWHYD